MPGLTNQTSDLSVDRSLAKSLAWDTSDKFLVTIILESKAQTGGVSLGQLSVIDEGFRCPKMFFT